MVTFSTSVIGTENKLKELKKLLEDLFGAEAAHAELVPVDIGIKTVMNVSSIMKIVTLLILIIACSKEDILLFYSGIFDRSIDYAIK